MKTMTELFTNKQNQIKNKNVQRSLEMIVNPCLKFMGRRELIFLKTSTLQENLAYEGNEGGNMANNSPKKKATPVQMVQH